MQKLIYNATLVLPEQVIEHGWLLIEEQRIHDLGVEATCPPRTSPGVINAHESLLLPGLIDLHCDAIEKLVEPRPNVHFDLSLALQEADLRLATCGITHEFHAVSLDDNEFGVRSDTFMRELFQMLKEKQEDLLIRHKIHARLELSSERGSDIIEQMIAMRACDLVSLMDHSPGQGQYRTVESFRDYVARTTNRSQSEIDALLELKRAQATHLPARIERVARLVKEADLALATHDDDSAIRVEQWPSLGVSLSEFPTTMEAAQRAHQLGMAVCMGAPNVLRGRSSGGNLSALTAIQAGVADVLCSDYYPSAMLAAIFILAEKQILTLPHAVRLTTFNPACAVGLGKDYGSLEVGKVADLILVSHSRGALPRIEYLFIGGEEHLKVKQ